MAKQVEAWEAGSQNTLGLVVDTDGTFLALTRVEPRSFKSRAAAVKRPARPGYRPDGSKM